MSIMGRHAELMLELGAIEDDLAARLLEGYRALAMAAGRTRDPTALRIARTTADIAEAIAQAATRRAIVIDEMIEAAAAETTMLTVPRPAKGRRGRQAARP